MHDLAVMGDWLGFAVRWLHVIAAIAWIGSSFYFIALDLGLRPAPSLPPGASGEEWQVHGGGFYHIRKFLVAPEAMPEHLTWFKWEAYTTWLSGAALLAIVYWAGAELYLIDPARADLAVWQAVALSAGVIAGGWLVYDRLCVSRLASRPTTLMLVLFAIIVALSWGLNQIFTGRAALLHLGAVTATAMTANVFLVIMPNQRVVVADLKAGRVPDPKYGRIAKLRSTHNNYLTLPVLFLMLSHHTPLAFATDNAWIIASLTFLMGVTIRHFFNTVHAGQRHALVDLGRHGRGVPRDHVALHRADAARRAPRGGRERSGGARAHPPRGALHAGGRLRGGRLHRHGALLDVPRGGALLGRPPLGPEGRAARHRARDRAARPRDLPPGRDHPRHAPRQPFRHHPGGARRHRPVVPGRHRRPPRPPPGGPSRGLRPARRGPGASPTPRSAEGPSRAPALGAPLAPPATVGDDASTHAQGVDDPEPPRARSCERRRRLPRCEGVREVGRARLRSAAAPTTARGSSPGPSAVPGSPADERDGGTPPRGPGRPGQPCERARASPLDTTSRSGRTPAAGSRAAPVRIPLRDARGGVAASG